jgi:hypothetical protein
MCNFTRRIDGSLVAGPNAVPALAREGYRLEAISLPKRTRCFSPSFSRDRLIQANSTFHCGVDLA